MSRRFGSDKAQAVLAGRTLLDLAMAALYMHCEEIVVVGRGDQDIVSADDWPRPGMGPLGGIAGALNHAARKGFDQLLSIPVDCVTLPANLGALLKPAPSYIASQPVIGLWPVGSLDPLRSILTEGQDLAVMAFVRTIGARAVYGGFTPPNINTKDDLRRFEADMPTDSSDRRWRPGMD